MKFAAVITFAAAALVVSAETNAQRMARGLPPASPMKRGSHTEGKRATHPSHPCLTPSLHRSLEAPPIWEGQGR